MGRGLTKFGFGNFERMRPRTILILQLIWSHQLSGRVKLGERGAGLVCLHTQTLQWKPGKTFQSSLRTEVGVLEAIKPVETSDDQ